MIGINIVSVIVLLGILIFVHELGHFLVAKACGVGVTTFSLGFGPRIIGRKWGETEYRLSLVPLGGYVRLLGESAEDELCPEDAHRSFLAQRVYTRIGIVAAGPVFNFLFAIIAFAIVFSTGVPVVTTRVGEVKENTAAYEAGIQKGDVITAIDGKQVSRWSELVDAVRESGGKPLVLSVKRDGAVKRMTITPRPVKDRNLFGEEIESYQVGIGMSDESVVTRMNPARAVIRGLEETWSWVELIFVVIMKMVQRVVPVSELGGPILIAQMAGAQAQKGILSFIYFMAILSVNLGVLNLFPIPVLDGGHILFFLIEAVTGREVSVKWREMAQQVGFFLLIMLTLLVFYNDIMRIING
ncbi:MAG: RIP metalloprotease RseP [Deltaproteobacteria bacterium]|nr:RIP metalloprotease RseP [Deltaproteobacteria bacterium]